MALFALGLGDPVVASAAWSQPARVSEAGHLSTYPQVGLDRRGDAIAVWMDERGQALYRIMASRRLGSSEAWSRPVALSPPHEFGGSPELAVDPSGAVVTVWEEGGVSLGHTPPGQPVVDAAFKRSPTSPWSRAVRISARGVDSEGAEVAINARGQVVAIWVATTPTSSSVEVSTMNVARGVWSAPVVLQTAPKLAIWPQVVINRSGEAFAVWKRFIRHTGPSGIGQGDTQWWVGAAVKPPGRRSWRMLDRLGREEEPSLQGDAATEQPGPHLVADESGNAIAVWQGGTASKIVTDVAVWRARRDAWSRGKPISQHFALWPQVAASPTGYATVVWEGANDSVVAASTRIATGTWSAPKTIGSATPPAFAPNLMVAMDRRGDALASWIGGHPQVSLRTGVARNWRAPVALTSQPGLTVDVAINSPSQAVAVWQQTNGPHGGMSVEASTYAGPK